VAPAKGLSADYVFISHFDDQYLIENEQSLTDKEVCNFLVALTRARKKVFLISSTKAEPTFLKWIKKERIARATVNPPQIDHTPLPTPISPRSGRR
jgi:superfamily I DNA/RNA helicase